MVGRWGLDSLLETSGMSEYYERELKYKHVVTDEHGAPVHPDTRKRTVRICSRYSEEIKQYDKYIDKCVKRDTIFDECVLQEGGILPEHDVLFDFPVRNLLPPS
jgi:hypothetical protein